MMTRARPMAMSRSRVQTRSSLRRLFAGEPASGEAAAGEFAETGVLENEGSGFSGWVEAPRRFWSERSILGATLFIAWATRGAPDAILVLCMIELGAARPPSSYDADGRG